MKELEVLHASIKLSIYNPDTESTSMFGPGIAALCEGVRTAGSLNAATRQLGMAYSKAWRIVKETEDALGFQLLDRDGAHGSALTAQGNAILNTYIELKKSLEMYAENELDNLVSAY